jgi:hypothetical protein
MWSNLCHHIRVFAPVLANAAFGVSVPNVDVNPSGTVSIGTNGGPPCTVAGPIKPKMATSAVADLSTISGNHRQ